MDNKEKIKNSAIYKYIKDYLPVIPMLEVKKGKYLFRAECEDGNIFYILEGVIKIENISYNGKKLMIDTVQKGDFCGFISNIHHASFRCSGLAETNVKALVLKKTLMNELMQNDGFSSMFYRETSRHVYTMYKNMLARSLFSQNEIMAYYMLQNCEDDVFKYKSIYSICENLGISRRGVYNILYRFEEADCIVKDDLSYRIIDKEYLEKVAGQVIEFMKDDYD